MAKIFLDTNILIDLIEKRATVTPDKFKDDAAFISPLSIHILMYVLKRKVPFSKLLMTIKPFSIINLSKKVSVQALVGPTSDFEDNVQLHSCAEATCDFFLTADKDLLDMKFFGKTQIISHEDLK